MKLTLCGGRLWVASIRGCVPGKLISATAMALFMLAGCAGFESKALKFDSKDNNGIVYYMPRRPIIVQVVFDAASVKTITVPSASAIPDLSQPYLLTVPDNGIGQSHATIQIGTNGLLQSAATVETSGAQALAKAIAADLGTISGLAGHGFLAAAAPHAAPPAHPAPPCDNSRTYSLVIWPEDYPHPDDELNKICDLPVILKNLGGISTLETRPKDSDYANAQPGIFFKTEIPYLVIVGSEAQGQAFIAYSPDQAPTQFVPLKKSFFANNTTTFTLNTDGLLTKADSDIGGEITGLATLPADIISAYMNALGSIFTGLVTNNTNKNSLAVSDALRQACLAAIAANPIQGVSDSQAAAKYAAIKAACSP